MPFYQILVAIEPEPDKLRCLLRDLSEPQLLAQFVKPYRSGRDLICGNQIVPVTALRKIHIIRTAREDEREREALNEKSLKEIEAINRKPGGLLFLSPGRGYEPEDIFEVGADVTAEFISGPPGVTYGQNRLSHLLSNPWVVAVGTGLIVAGIVWWLGWS